MQDFQPGVRSDYSNLSLNAIQNIQNNSEHFVLNSYIDVLSYLFILLLPITLLLRDFALTRPEYYTNDNVRFKAIGVDGPWLRLSNLLDNFCSARSGIADSSLRLSSVGGLQEVTSLPCHQSRVWIMLVLYPHGAFSFLFNSIVFSYQYE
jgi:hypothetical protein